MADGIIKYEYGRREYEPEESVVLAFFSILKGMYCLFEEKYSERLRNLESVKHYWGGKIPSHMNTIRNIHIKRDEFEREYRKKAIDIASCIEEGREFEVAFLIPKLDDFALRVIQYNNMRVFDCNNMVCPGTDPTYSVVENDLVSDSLLYDRARLYVSQSQENICRILGVDSLKKSIPIRKEELQRAIGYLKKAA